MKLSNTMTERMRACLLQLGQQEQMLEAHQQTVGQIKRDRDNLAANMRRLAEGEESEEDDFSDLESCTKAWAREADKFEVGDRRRRRMADSVNKLRDQFMAICRHAFGFDGQLPFEDANAHDAWRGVLIADLVGGDVLASPYSDHGFTTVADVFDRHEEMVALIRPGNLTRTQVDYLFEVVGTYLDRAGVIHKIPAPKKNAIARHFAADQPPATRQKPAPKPESEPESEPDGSDKIDAPATPADHDPGVIARIGAPGEAAADAPKKKRGRPRTRVANE